MSQIKWSATSGGDWATKTDWTGGVVPTSADDAVIAAAGTYTVTVTSADAAKSLTVNNASATVAVNGNGVLTLGGALTVTAGTVQLNSGGEISGGVLSATGGAFVWSAGALDGVTYEGTLDLSVQNFESVYITSKGLIAKGAGGVGNGTINLTGNDSFLYLQGTQTLDKATVDIGNVNNTDYIEEDDIVGKGAVVTLGAGLTIDQTGFSAGITGTGTVGDAVVNKGVINASFNTGTAASAQFLINPLSFTNAGTINVANGETLTLRAATLNNAGGTITVDKVSVVDLYSNLTTTQLGGFNNAGTVSILGTLTNSGAVLAVGTGSKLGTLTLSGGGEISGGTITDAGKGVTFSAGALDGVTYEGTLDLSVQNFESVYITSKGLIAKGAGGVGNGTINLTGNDSFLYLQGTQTLDKATVDIGNVNNTDYIEEDDIVGKGAVVTLGAGLTIDQTGFSAGITGTGTVGDAVVNKGVINASFNTGTAASAQFLINPLSFTNAGTINVANGETLTLRAATLNNAGGTITVDKVSVVDLYSNLTTTQLGGFNNAGTVSILGTLTNSGAVLAVGTGSKLGTLTLSGGGEISGGTITDAGKGVTFSAGALDGVTYEGTLDLSVQNFESVYITSKGLIAKGAGGVGNGTIKLTGNDSFLYLQGTQTLDKATVDIGNVNNTDYIEEDDIVGKGAVVTLGAGLTIDQTGFSAGITGTGTVGDAVVNKGVINASFNTGTAASAQFLINPLSFTNAGTINVANGETLTLRAATLNNAGGTITVDKVSVVDLYSNLTTTQLGGFNNAGTVSILGTLTNSGAVLAVGTGSKLGTLTLSGGGEISGGTITDAGKGVTFSAGALDGVTYEGTLDLSVQNFESVYITSKGLIAKGAGGVGNGTIKLTGNDSFLYLQGTQTLDKATVDIGNVNNTDYIEEDDIVGKGAVVTLGAGLTIDQTGFSAGITGTGTVGDAVVNKGVINASFSSGQFLIDPLAFTNTGTITVSNGETVTIRTLFNDIAGKLNVGKGSTVNLSSSTVAEVQGAISNAGTIAVQGSGGANTDIRVFAAGVTLSGAGTVTLGGSTSRILGVSTAATLTNVDNTIKGAGFIGLGDMTLINKAAGVIDASTAGNIVLDTAGKTLANAGLLEATNGETLVIASTTVNNAGGGMITAIASKVDLQVSDIIGGTLKSAGGAIAVNALGSTLDGTGGHAVTLAGGQIALDDRTSLNLLGSIVNKGTFLVAGVSGATDLLVGAGGATLSGGGGVTLTANAFNGVTASVAATLDNVDNRITGAGTIGNANLTLINEAKGFVGSNSSVALTINTGAHIVTNAGIIEGGNGSGGLTITGAVANTGKLIAFNGNLTVTGAVTGAGTATLAGGVLAFGGSFDEAVTFGAGTSTLALADSVAYGATITGFSTKGSTRLDLKDIGFKSSGEAKFAGGVHSTVSDGTHTAHIHLAGSFTGSTFVASSDGHGGTIVVDPAAGAAARFVSAMAAMPAAPPNHAAPADSWREAARATLAMPRTGQIA